VYGAYIHPAITYPPFPFRYSAPLHLHGPADPCPTYALPDGPGRHAGRGWMCVGLPLMFTGVRGARRGALGCGHQIKRLCVSAVASRQRASVECVLLGCCPPHCAALAASNEKRRRHAVLAEPSWLELYQIHHSITNHHTKGRAHTGP
jgi:hypothetical protein